ncbi:tripartite tricarboxylate transporter substrate-binding protein [Corticibacterium sp. UT-5YL-CI-8]|nr:tripartite tricarboxylate transporter substrate-binding protein [Tianweitania sp. UT-5YL-CI-8]
MHDFVKRLTSYAATAALLLSAATATLAADVDFAGKRIEIIISSAEGGGADTYARFVAAALEKELPGKPTILARNMTGGGGLISANWFEANAKPDGLIIYSAASSSKLSPLFGDPGNVHFNPNAWIPVVTSPNGYVVEGSRIAGSDSIKALLAAGDKPQTIGLASVLGASTMVLLAFDMLGVNIKPAFNVPGGDAQLSFERGEFTLNSDSAGSFFRLNGKNVEDGKVAPLFSFGTRGKNGMIGRDPSLPDVPSFPEVYKEVHGKDPSGPAWDAWVGLFDIISTNSKTIMLPTGTPDDVVQVYRAAAERALTNPELVKSEQYKNILGETPQLFGEAAKQGADLAAKGLNQDSVKWLREWHKTKFQVAI